MTISDKPVVQIERIGFEGDGIAFGPAGETLYIPDALPGEQVHLGSRTRYGGGWFVPHQGVLTPSEARIPPACGHFPSCGGCVLQHWRTSEYAAWKTGLLLRALDRAGCQTDLALPLWIAAPQTRRRMDLAFSRVGRGVVVGLHRRHEQTIVDLHTCSILLPELVNLIAPLRALLGQLNGFRRTGSAIVNRLDHGADLLLRTDQSLTVHDRNLLVAFARDNLLLRASWAPLQGAPEPVCVLQPPRIVFSGVACEPPPGAFLQATAEGEARIVAAVLAGLPNSVSARARIVELYAGCGTLTFALAQRARVVAWDGEPTAVAASKAAANRGGLAGRVDTVRRDLARQPLTPQELAGAAAVVLDPPHAGAAPSIPSLVAARVPTVIYVSCNPSTLGRDAAVLRAGGYALVSISPIDQFLWSAQLEAVCVFRLTSRVRKNGR
jgi:23S rRNA (uracil1939-C5)-methyltransferase